MKRFQFCYKATQRKSEDPSNPDTRPIKPIIESPSIRRPKTRSTCQFSTIPYKKPLPSLLKGDEITFQYEPPIIPTESNSDPVHNFVKTMKGYDFHHQDNTKKVIKLNQLLIRPKSHVSQSKNENHITTNFVKNFLLGKQVNLSAQIIQNAMRVFLKKLHFKQLLHHHMDINAKLKKIIMISWKVRCINDPELLHKYYNQFFEVFQGMRFSFKPKKKAPFKLFYINQRFFMTKKYSTDIIYSFIYMMTMPLLRSIIRKWLLLAKNKKIHTITMRSIRYAGKQWGCHGLIIQFFQLWHQYTKWKKVYRNSSFSIEFIQVKCNYVNVFWNAIENRLNKQRTRKIQAGKYFKKKMKLKALRALYNYKLKRNTKARLIRENAKFRDRRLMKVSQEGWSKFMERRKNEYGILKNYLGEWYSYSYKSANTKVKVDIFILKRTKKLIVNIMNEWFKISQLTKVKYIKLMSHLQSNPSKALMIIFFLKGQFELYFLAFTFRMWIRFNYARKRWMNFARWACLPNENQEMKALILSELRRINTLKLLQRKFIGSGLYIPRKMGFSFRLAFREYITRKKTEEKMINDCQSDKWKFITTYENKKPPTFNLDVFLRSILLKLNRSKNYETYESLKISNSEAASSYENLKTLSEIQSRCEKNIEFLKAILKFKLMRDKNILTRLMSHDSALKAQKVFPDFSADKDFTFIFNISRSFDKQNVIIYPETNQSLKEIEFRLKFHKPRVSYNFDEIETKMTNDFEKRLRNPTEIEEDNFQPVQKNVKSARYMVNSQIKNFLISGYVYIPPRETDTSNITVQENTVDTKLSQSHEALNNEYFTINNLYQLLDYFDNREELIKVLSHFFHVICEMMLNTSKLITISKPEEIVPNVEQTSRHKMICNIGAFLAQLAGYSDISKVPRMVKAPKFANATVDSILTMHNSLLRSPLSQYCDKIPFSSKILFNDMFVNEAYTQLWYALTKRFPKIKLPDDDAFKFSSNGEKVPITLLEDDLSSENAIIGCFLLPFIISFDSVKDFIADEIIGKTNY